MTECWHGTVQVFALSFVMGGIIGAILTLWFTEKNRY